MIGLKDILQVDGGIIVSLLRELPLRWWLFRTAARAAVIAAMVAARSTVIAVVVTLMVSISISILLFKDFHRSDLAAASGSRGSRRHSRG